MDEPLESSVCGIDAGFEDYADVVGELEGSAVGWCVGGDVFGAVPGWCGEGGMEVVKVHRGFIVKVLGGFSPPRGHDVREVVEDRKEVDKVARGGFDEIMGHNFGSLHAFVVWIEASSAETDAMHCACCVPVKC